MCILKRIAIVQSNLMKQELPKSGHNKFGNFAYHELEDILPPIQLECFQQELILLFDFTSEKAILRVTNWNDIKDYVEFTVPMPEIVAMNKKMNIMQSEGSYITYLKKYLLGNAFLILEKSVAEIIPHEVEEKKNTLNKKSEIPSIINTALIDLERKGLPITKQAVFTKCQSKLTDDNRQEIIDWIDKNVEATR